VAAGPLVAHAQQGERVDCDAIVQLSNESRDNRDQALFQLAHETVHVLSPVDVGTTTALEEGLATYFSLTAPILPIQPMPNAVKPADRQISGVPRCA
jgi:hypothetical protein